MFRLSGVYAANNEEDPFEPVFPQSPSYSLPLTAVFADTTQDLTFNFKFGDSTRSRLETHDLPIQEIKVPEGREPRKVLLFYKASSGVLQGLLMFDKANQLLLEAPKDSQEELQDRYPFHEVKLEANERICGFQS